MKIKRETLNFAELLVELETKERRELFSAMLVEIFWC